MAKSMSSMVTRSRGGERPPACLNNVNATCDDSSPDRSHRRIDSMDKAIGADPDVDLEASSQYNTAPVEVPSEVHRFGLSQSDRIPLIGWGKSSAGSRAQNPLPHVGSGDGRFDDVDVDVVNQELSQADHDFSTFGAVTWGQVNDERVVNRWTDDSICETDNRDMIRGNDEEHLINYNDELNDDLGCNASAELRESRAISKHSQECRSGFGGMSQTHSIEGAYDIARFSRKQKEKGEMLYRSLDGRSHDEFLENSFYSVDGDNDNPHRSSSHSEVLSRPVLGRGRGLSKNNPDRQFRNPVSPRIIGRGSRVVSDDDPTRQTLHTDGYVGGRPEINGSRMEDIQIHSTDKRARMEGQITGSLMAAREISNINVSSDKENNPRLIKETQINNKVRTNVGIQGSDSGRICDHRYLNENQISGRKDLNMPILERELLNEEINVLPGRQRMLRRTDNTKVGFSPWVEVFEDTEEGNSGRREGHKLKTGHSQKNNSVPMNAGKHNRNSYRNYPEYDWNEIFQDAEESDTDADVSNRYYGTRRITRCDLAQKNGGQRIRTANQSVVPEGMNTRDQCYSGARSTPLVSEDRRHRDDDYHIDGLIDERCVPGIRSGLGARESMDSHRQRRSESGLTRVELLRAALRREVLNERKSRFQSSAVSDDEFLIDELEEEAVMNQSEKALSKVRNLSYHDGSRSESNIMDSGGVRKSGYYRPEAQVGTSSRGQQRINGVNERMAAVQYALGDSDTDLEWDAQDRFQSQVNPGFDQPDAVIRREFRKARTEYERALKAKRDSLAKRQFRKYPEADEREEGLSRPKSTWSYPDKFDGQNISWSAFISRFQICARYNRWSDADRLTHLQLSLKGNADHVLWSEPDRVWTYNELVQVLERRYGNSDQVTLHRAELNARRRGKNESLASLHQDLLRLMSLAYVGRRDENTDAFAVEAFLKALDDHELSIKVRELEPKDLDQAVKHARRFESYIQSDRPRYEDRGRFHRNDGHVRAVTNTPSWPKKASISESTNPVLVTTPTRTETEFQELKAEVQRLTDQQKVAIPQNTPVVPLPNNVVGMPAMLPPNWQNSPPPPFVANQGHPPQSVFPPVRGNEQYPNQWQNKSYQSRKWRDNQAGNNGRSNVCFICQQPGHWRNNCPSLGQQVFTPTMVSRSKLINPSLNIRLAACQQERHSYIELEVLGTRHSCLLDSGCDQTLVPLGLVSGLRLMSTRKKLFAANGSRIPVRGEVNLVLTLNGVDLSVAALVSTEVGEIMLGLDWLTKHNIRWEFGSGQVIVHDQWIPLQAHPERKMCRMVSVRQNNTPNKSQSATADRHDCHRVIEKSRSHQVITSTEMRERVWTGRIILSEGVEELTMLELNTRSKTLMIERRSELSEVVVGRVQSEMDAKTSSSLNDHVELLVDKAVTPHSNSDRGNSDREYAGDRDREKPHQERSSNLSDVHQNKVHVSCVEGLEQSGFSGGNPGRHPNLVKIPRSENKESAGFCTNDEVGPRWLFRDQLRARRRRKGETLTALGQDVARLMTLAYEGRDVNTDAFTVEAFLRALDNHELSIKIRELEPADLDEAVRHAIRFESYIQSARPSYDSRCRSRCNEGQVQAVTDTANLPEKSTNANNVEPDQPVQLTRSEADFQKLVAEVQCLKEQSKVRISPNAHLITMPVNGGHRSYSMPIQLNWQDYPPLTYMNSPGRHSVPMEGQNSRMYGDQSRCNSAMNTTANMMRGQTVETVRSRTCFFCHQVGHWKRDCPTNKLGNKRNRYYERATNRQMTERTHSESEYQALLHEVQLLRVQQSGWFKRNDRVNPWHRGVVR